MSSMGKPGSNTREEELMKVLKAPVDWLATEEAKKSTTPETKLV